jgi:uncharacterized membrane protein
MRRRAVALLALLGALDATYLLLAKLGAIGSLSCTVSHDCDLVNTSGYSSFLGLPVAGIGVAGYLLLLAIAIAGLRPRWANDPRPDRALAFLSGLALAFTLYLTYLELFRLHALCQWCVVSQVIILAIFALSAVGVAGARRRVPAGD